jgi:hypothetical protein
VEFLLYILIQHESSDTQFLTLKEHPTVSLAFPPVGLHKVVLHLRLKKGLPFALDARLGMAEDGGQ